MKARSLRQRIFASPTCRTSAVFVRQRLATHGTPTRFPVVTSLGLKLREAAKETA